MYQTSAQPVSGDTHESQVALPLSSPRVAEEKTSQLEEQNDQDSESSYNPEGEGMADSTRRQTGRQATIVQSLTLRQKLKKADVAFFEAKTPLRRTLSSKYPSVVSRGRAVPST